jgi:aspartyl-tRNA synthetase
MRSRWCGELRAEHAGEEVALCGWVARRREHGEHLAFVDVRDATGVVQCVVDGAHDLRAEYVVRVRGVVRIRPEGTANHALATGDVEVGDADVEVLARAEPPPFPVDERGDDVDETLRLRHRYVDLRRDRMQRNLRARSAVNSALRRAMEEQGFVEVETPLLIASTPEGARDFVVPSRRDPGSFYALPQSPQLFKQLCMVGGVERYYQIARCLRDEDLRADRQYEFTQLDAEASFVGQEEVLAFISHAVRAATGAVTGADVDGVPRMTWHEAMERYGSDKPDVRFGLELVELTDVFGETKFRAFQVPCVKGICVPGAGDTSRSKLDDLTDRAKQWGAKGLVWMRVRDGDIESPVAKFLEEDETTRLLKSTGATPGDLLLLIADERRTVQLVLGLVRLELGRRPVSDGGYHFLWVVEFPLFEGIGEDGTPVPAHHPFTMPHTDDLDLLESDPLAVRSQAYDLVVNGWELGSGSVRIHRADLQERVLAVLGIDAATARERFGFLLDAFRYGPPPHAGFAFGVDRLVAVLTGEENIREVIAFPKTQSGADPLTGAPTPLEEAQLRELGLRVLQ